MAIDTKPNFSSNKFEQCVGDVMNLSGCTQIYGYLDIESTAVLTICDGAASGKILTSDSGGVASWQDAPAVGVTAVSGGSGMNFSPITSTGTVVLGTPSTITSGTTNAVGANTHCHAFQANTFVTGTQGILVDGNNRFYLDETYITNATLPSLYSYSGITANQSIGVLPSGQTLGMVYITNTGSSIAYINLGTTPTGDDITPYQTIQVDPNEDVSVTVNMRLSLTENKTIYINSDDWTNVGINLQWANITYQNASTTINPGDLPIASQTTLGAIKVGSGLTIDGSGILSTTGGTGGGTITGGTNGLGVSGANICLGGTLNANTTVCATGATTYDIVKGVGFSGTDGFYFNAATESVISKSTADFSCISSGYFTHECVNLYSNDTNASTCSNVAIGRNGNVGINLTNTLTISSDNSCPAQYFDDYSANFTCLSIPNVGWVTGLTSGGTGGFLGTVTLSTAEPVDPQENQWVKPAPTSTGCFNYTFTNFCDSGSTAINVNLSLEDVYLRYCDTGYWVKESYNKPLSSGYTWMGNSSCQVCEIPVINEWVSTPAEVQYPGQKYSYPTQTLFQVDIGSCVTIPNKILICNINMKTVANTCIFSIPAGMTALISSAKLIMLNDASPTSMCVSIGNNSCGTPSLSYQNMIPTVQIDDVLTREVYDITPTQSGAVICDGSCCGADVYFRVQSGSTSANALCAHLLVEGFLY